MTVKKYVQNYTENEVEAIQYISKPFVDEKSPGVTEYINNFPDIQKFCQSNMRYEFTYEELGKTLVMSLEPGDWLVSGDNTRWGYSNKAFKNTYTEVSKEVINKSKTDKI